MATSTLTISCACRQITGTLDVSSSVLPLLIDFCHCHTCRHVTGQLCNSQFIAPRSSGTPSHLSITGQPIAYKTSDHLTRYFCGSCGASIYNHDSITGNENIASGILEKAEGILIFKQHTFVDDTRDGGLSSWLEGLSWTGQPEHSEKTQPASRRASRNHPTEPIDLTSTLNCYCQCRGVQFEITRPNKDSSSVSSPVPDVMVPYHSQSAQNIPYFAWWLRANGTKYFAGTCACNSCRLATGYDIQAWAFVPKTNIRQSDGKELQYTMGSLGRYSHSPGAYREFCNTCGATVFWHCDERPGIVDISAGLLDAEQEPERKIGWNGLRKE